MKKLSNKKILFGFIAVLIVIILSALYFLSASKNNTGSRISDDSAQTKLYFSPSTNALPVSTVFDVIVKLDSGSNPVQAVETTITYDTSQFRLISIDKSSTVFDGVTTSSTTPGTITIIADADPTLTLPTGNNLTVLALQFSTTENQGSGLIQFTGDTYIVGNDISVLYTVDKPSVTYTVGNPTTSTTITPGVTTTATATPHVSATATPAVTTTVTPTINSPANCPRKGAGDANCDGKVTKADYTLWVNAYKLNETNGTVDFNNDGKVNIHDFILFRLTCVATGNRGDSCTQ